MNATVIGAVAGVVLALAVLQFGWWGFVLVVVLGAVGALVGAAVSGRVDLRALGDVLSGRRSSR